MSRRLIVEVDDKPIDADEHDAELTERVWGLAQKIVLKARGLLEMIPDMSYEEALMHYENIVSEGDERQVHAADCGCRIQGRTDPNDGR